MLLDACANGEWDLMFLCSSEMFSCDGRPEFQSAVGCG